MNRFLVLFISGLLYFNITTDAQKRVVDAIDETPVSSASIFNAAGNVIGFTSDEGDFSEIPQSAYPITIRCIGYENLIVEHSKDTILQMFPAEYELADVVVSAKREVMKQTFYVREYFTLCNETDTVTAFIEHMADRYISASKKVKFGKNSLRVRNTRCYSLYNVDDIDSVAVSSETSFPSALNLVYFNNDQIESPASFKEQDGAPKLYEEEGKSGMLRVQKQNAHTFTIIEDPLAGVKDHSYSLWGLKLLGLSMDFLQMRNTQAFRVNETGIYQPKDLSQAGFVFEAKGKGKYIRMLLDSKTPVDMHCSVELYVVDREYISKEQAKKEYKDKQSIVEFQIPDNVPELNEATQLLIKRAESK